MNNECKDYQRNDPPYCECPTQWTQEEWEKVMIQVNELNGWKNDRDDDTTLGFSCIDGEHHWIKDYNKKTRSFVQYDGNQKINLKVSK